jgi:signal transduction histidine kinase
LTLERVEESQLELSAEKRLYAIKAISSRSKQLGRLIEDLLDIDGLEAGSEGLTSGRSNIDELVLNATEHLDLQGHRLHIDIGISPLQVSVDKPKLERIVQALVHNGIKHTPVGTQIWVKASCSDSELFIAIEDDGPGVPDEFKAEAFEAFSRGTTAPSSSPGFGIGLTLVARLVAQQGGRVQICDRVGGGARFEIRLPLEQSINPPVAV